jgi:hypothetical protein
MQIFKEKNIVNEKGEKTAAILPIKKSLSKAILQASRYR